MKYNELFTAISIAFLAFIAPIQWLMIGVGALIILDTITGVFKAYKKNIPISSRRFGHIISKMLLYQVAIISAYLVELMIGHSEFLPIARIVTVGIGLTELKSILENLSLVTGTNIWSFLLSYLKRKDEVIGDIAEKISEEQKS